MTGFSLQAATAGILASLVGFASATVVVPGLLAVGATPAQAASGLMALSIAMGVCGVLMSLLTRMPISIAWSTPGAALLASAGLVEGGFAAAVGAFLVTGLMIVLAGLWKPLSRWVAAIPAPLANAMLAGVLFQLCVAPVYAVLELPVLAVLIAVTTDIPAGSLTPVTPEPLLVMPTLNLAAVMGIALPLFIVTMASQNITGIAVLKTYDYHPNPGRMFTVTGVFSLLAAPFGGHGINLAAITAAMCAGEEAHPDRARRYWAAATAGVCYILLGLVAGAAAGFMEASPPILIEAVAGLALLGAFGSSLSSALGAPDDREAAAVTFIITASGITVMGIGGAFWGLLAGGLLMALMRSRRSAA
jgi:benzoate membrane transport protein